MKKKLFILISALLACVCIFAGCGGTYVPPGDSENPGIDVPGNPADPASNDPDFTVTLIYNNSVYRQTSGLTVSWNDGLSNPVTATFGTDSVARASGLDGDYRVTVKGLPSTYTYDPNGTIATNFDRHVKVTIYRITVPRPDPANDGKSVNRPISLLATGAYRVTLNSKGDQTYFTYTPRKQGTYVVKSLVDVFDNEINPRYLEVIHTYAGGTTEIDGSAASSTFTVNFSEGKDFNSDNIGAPFIFGATGETRSQSYPATYEFLLDRADDYQREDYVAEIAVPAETEGLTSANKAAFIDEKDALMRASGDTFVAFEDRTFYPSRILDGKLVGMGSDGYYRLLDPVTGEATGAVICARITSTVNVLQEAFNLVESHGNKALTVDDNYDKFYKKTAPKYSDKDYHFINYKIFIEGYAAVAGATGGRPNPGGSSSSGTTAGASVYDNYKGVLGYADIVNSDGVYPVNAELQRFLQGYATQARLFMDGNGVAEGYGLKSAEEDQWLFACGYYK